MVLSDTMRESLVKHVDVWMKVGLSTTRADRGRAEETIRKAYTIVGLPVPSRYVWLDSPLAGAIAAAQLSSALPSVHTRVWTKPQEFMMKKLFQKAEAAKTLEMWKDVQAHLNRSALMGLRNNIVIPVGKQIVNQQRNRNQQVRASVFTRARDSKSNLSAEIWNRAITSVKHELTPPELKKLNNQVTWESIGEMLKICGFGSMDAAFLGLYDYADLYGFQLRDVEAIVAMARQTGWWWAFNDLCIITEKPTKVFIDRGVQLHKENGYAIEYADQWGLYALHGAIVTKDVAESAARVTIE